MNRILGKVFAMTYSNPPVKYSENKKKARFMLNTQKSKSNLQKKMKNSKNKARHLLVFLSLN